MKRISHAADPHGRVPAAEGGAPFSRARLALVMLHGRGGTPSDMLQLAEHLALPDIAIVAPQAADRSWWPKSFLAPLDANEPWLTSGLNAVASVVDALKRSGIGFERIVVMGFSQGACLAAEYVARAAEPFRGVAALSGALIGTAETGARPSDALYGYAPKRFDYDGRLDRVPMLMGCHERDPHIPLARVYESAAVFERLGANVTTQIYPGAGHGVVDQELRYIRRMLNSS